MHINAFFSALLFLPNRSLCISVLGLCAFLVISVFTGMSLYSIFKDCDPWKVGLVSAPDQVGLRQNTGADEVQSASHKNSFH